MGKAEPFIKKPKNSGYQSLHMQVQFPNMRKVEIQIRTMGMDYWSVMEHELQYKKKSKIGRSLHKELLACASDMRRMACRTCGAYWINSIERTQNKTAAEYNCSSFLLLFGLVAGRRFAWYNGRKCEVNGDWKQD
mgnify:CR=1 FL=1